MAAVFTDLVAVEHVVDIAAPARAIYALVANTSRWPHIFGPTVHVELLDHIDGQERLRLWATANGEVRNWTSRRNLDPGALSIRFQQEKCSSPVAEMGGHWLISTIDAGTCRVRLLHDYRAVSADQLPWIEAAVDRNSQSELQALKRAAEQDPDQPGIEVSFADSVLIEGDPGSAYAFLAEAEKWPERLTHVSRLQLRTDPELVQHMVMDTTAKDGSLHRTESIRVCFPEERIVYKQTVTPPIMAAHTGEWTVRPTGSRVMVSSQHTVRLRPDMIAELLGDRVTIPAAAAEVRAILSANSRMTLQSTKEYVENLAGRA